MNYVVIDEIRNTQYKGTALLDPRCKMIILILDGLFCYFLRGDISGILLTLGLCIFISLGGCSKFAIKGFLFYISVFCFNHLFGYVTVPVLTVIVSVFGVTLLKIIPIFMFGKWVLITTPMDDFMISLQRMKFSQAVTIPLTVMFRYIPTLAIEYKMIRNAMEIRGICDTFLKKVLHPIKTTEYILIPLLMRCLKVTDELAASGVTRGLECETKRYSIRTIHFGFKEYMTVGIVGVILIVLLSADIAVLSEISLWREIFI